MQDGTQEAGAYFQSDDICVSVDGTWLTQGLSSLHGIGTLCSTTDPPKVLDHQLLSQYCSEYAGLVGVKISDGELYDKLLTEHCTDGGAELIAEALKINRSLTWLHMESPDITDKGAFALARAITVRRRRFGYFHLNTNCAISDKGKDAIATALCLKAIQNL
ncbi:unnamed protein product [Didymodactylos carnosus]|uniref:Uncharacterized protein n=1 Tax=Didymodactylos carnosus TaxID=1234261 RepID=A0A815K211_9BILA|nr:unnamed protein product [Didymodactylos carnosus]CAF1487709.1 unnamed protein product [Didymodactylos carnosus]CAF4277425.1 unnamed protein product [Didymodactylos carnosus]CAF4284469.1 unnamed protein product [Didymodactylos carnosus]